MSKNNEHKAFVLYMGVIPVVVDKSNHVSIIETSFNYMPQKH